MRIDNNNHKKVAVVGVGNILLSDEGIGVHVVNKLREARPDDKIPVEIIDGGTSPGFFWLIEGFDRLILIDAVKGGGKPGSIYRFQVEQIVPEEKQIISAHDLDLMYNLKMMELTGSRPKEVIIIGIEPKEIKTGMELSPELDKMIPHIIKIVNEEIDQASSG